ncbi:SRPBCC family protein [Flavobacterium sp.]|uniref:SRPBCC family protein n=1 Tax=Flavobacterium sp. TaxID=239 RepID=UPI0039E4137A
MKSINTYAPIIAYKTIEINAGIETVWQKLTAVEAWPEWHREIKHARLNGKLEKNTSIIWETAGMKIKSELHTVNPPTHFGWTGKSFGLYAIHNFRLFDLDGKTQVLVEESMEGWLTLFLKKSLKNILDKSLQQWLVELKSACENPTKMSRLEATLQESA